MRNTINDQNAPTARARKHLDKRLTPLRGDANWVRPPKGWIRAIRDALGMTTRQFAKRLGIAQPTAVQLEKGEINQTITLRRLRAAAEALDCTLVYALVPRKPLDTLVEDQARSLAEQELARLNHTMALENQALDQEDLLAERERLVRLILNASPRQLWEEA